MEGRVGSEWVLGETEWVARAEEKVFAGKKNSILQIQLTFDFFCQATLVPLLLFETKPCNVVTPQCSISLLLVSIPIFPFSFNIHHC